MKVLTTITLRGSHKLLRVGSIRSPAALPRIALRGRAFLSEQADDIRFCCYKGGQSEACPPTSVVLVRVGTLRFAHPTIPSGVLLLRRLPLAAGHHALEPLADDGFGVADDAGDELGAGGDVVDQAL